MAIIYKRGVEGVSYTGIDRAKQIGGAVMRAVTSAPRKFVNSVIDANKGVADFNKKQNQAWYDEMVSKRGDPDQWPENKARKAKMRVFGGESNYRAMDGLMQ